MSNFDYTVKKNDGLTYIFKQKAKDEGYNTDSITNWNEVMNVFDKIQKQKQAQGQALFSGGTDKSKAGWHNSYVIKTGQKIELDDNQMSEIYEAMGLKKSTQKSAETAAPAGPAPTTPKEAGCREEDTQLNSGNVSGTYNLCTGENGTGHRLVSNLEIKGEAEASKFFKDDSYNKETKTYTDRNIAGTDENSVRLQAGAEAQRLSVGAAIYKDLSSKQASGTTLTAPEQSFIAELPKDLQDAGLALNKDNQIIEDTTPAKTTITAAPLEAKTTTTIASPKTPEEAGCREQDTQLSSGNVSGTYNLCSGDESQKYNLLIDNIKIEGEAEANKFFTTDSYDKKTKQYSIRNIKGDDENTVRLQAAAQAQKFSINSAIYKNLSEKQKAGTQLTEAEKAFISDYLSTLKQAGLMLNNKNEIVDISTENAKKSFFKRRFGG